MAKFPTFASYISPYSSIFPILDIPVNWPRTYNCWNYFPVAPHWRKHSVRSLLYTLTIISPHDHDLTQPTGPRNSWHASVPWKEEVRRRWHGQHSILFWCSSHPRQWYDWETRGLFNDFLSDAGFLWALRDTLRLSRGSLLWGGLPCCSYLDIKQLTWLCRFIFSISEMLCPFQLRWVWIASGTHARNRSILGDDRTLHNYMHFHELDVGFFFDCWIVFLKTEEHDWYNQEMQ